jgi:hypothetical protein
MRPARLLWLTPLLAVLAGGCGFTSGEEEVVREDAPARRPFGEPIDIPFADLLGKPRAELAALADEWTARVQIQEKARREGTLTFALLPELRLPLVVPVLREAKYCPEAGVSLPPYLPPGRPDAALALHLARYGDVEAARRLADPADADALARIDHCRGERNYPLEWTRLVGVMLHSVQLRLASGDSEAGAELATLHGKVREALDARSAAGPLGAALLSRGRKTLALAAAAWRAGGQAERAAAAEAALGAWGDVPAPAAAVRPGAEPAELARALGGPPQGRVLPAATAARGLDLLELPLPAEGVQAVLACLAPDGRLAEVLVTYRAGLAHLFPEPRYLAHLLEDRGLPAEDAHAPGLARRTYRGAGLCWEVTVVPRCDAAGALVRLAADGPAPPAGPLPRDFGAAHLDRGFEQNRLRLAPDRLGATVEADRGDLLAGLVQPLRGVPLVGAVLHRAGDQDVTARLVLRYAGEGDRAPLLPTALGLWAAGAPGGITGVDDEDGGHLAFVWEDARTRTTLRLPYARGRALELEAEDRGGGDRAAAARAFDRDERRTRLAAGKPLTRLPRSLGFEGVRLGRTRAEVLRALPKGSKVLRQGLPDGLGVVLAGDPARGVRCTPRHLFVRFDGAGRAVEIRLRFGEAAGGGAWAQALLGGLKQHGAAAEAPGPWAALWRDLPARKPPAALYRWQDDLTLLTCQCDAGLAELTLRDASGPDGVPTALPPLAYLPRGPGDVSLGDTREAVGKLAARWHQTADDGALVVRPGAGAPYDLLFVWLEGDRVTRIVARHVPAGSGGARPAQMAQLLREAWGRDARALGWPSRQDLSPDQVVQGLGWHDDRTRVRAFWQEADGGALRLFTEWRAIDRP